MAAFLLPAGKLSPILSSFSRRERPPFFDLALQKEQVDSCEILHTVNARLWSRSRKVCKCNKIKMPFFILFTHYHYFASISKEILAYKL